MCAHESGKVTEQVKLLNLVDFSQVSGWKLKVRLYYQVFINVTPAHLLLIKFCEKDETHV